MSTLKSDVTSLDVIAPYCIVHQVRKTKVGCRSLFMHGDGEAGIPKKSDQNDTRMNKIQNEQHPKQSVNDNIGKFDIQNSLVPQY